MTRRQLSLTIASLFILLGIYILASHHAIFFPDLPFHSVPKNTVVTLLNEKSSNQIKKLAFDDGHVWYGAKADQGKEIERLLTAMKSDGWLFLQQEGSGYFFKRGEENIVITSRMWSSKFVLFKSPVTIHSLTQTDSL